MINIVTLWTSQGELTDRQALAPRRTGAVRGQHPQPDVVMSRERITQTQERVDRPAEIGGGEIRRNDMQELDGGYPTATVIER